MKRCTPTFHWIFLSVLMGVLISIFTFSGARAERRRCDYTIKLRKNKITTIDGRKSGIGGVPGANPRMFTAGKVICILAGNYRALRIRNIKGQPANPVTFINHRGRVRFQNSGDSGILIQNSRYIRVSGAGDKTKYGILIKGKYGKGIRIRNRSGDFEIDHIEIAKTRGAGILANTRGSCSDGKRPRGQKYMDMYDYDGDGQAEGDRDDITSQKNFIQLNTHIHDNYLHDTGTEGLYIGGNRTLHLYYPDGKPGPAMGESTYCQNGTKDPLNIKLKGVRIHDNILKRTGWDSINVKSGARDCHIYQNRISQDGRKRKKHQWGGVNLTPDTHCNVYRNIIKDGNGPGIYSMGVGGIIANNLIVRPGRGFKKYSINAGGIILATSKTIAGNKYTQDRRGIYRGHKFQVYNNTIVQARHMGVSFGVFYGDVHELANNLIVQTLKPRKRPVLRVDKRTRLRVEQANMAVPGLAGIRFRNPARGDYRLKKGSPAIGRGVRPSFRSEILELDLSNHKRPAGAFDVGAYGYGE